VLSALLGRVLLPLALVAGITLQIAYPGDFEYVLEDTAPAWIVWFAVAGGVVALILGLVRRRAPFEAPAAMAAALFLAPVFFVGLLNWDRAATPLNATLSPGLVAAVRAEVSSGAIVYSDQETSFRIAASASVFIAVAPPGHVADTEKNRPYERARDARRFLRTGDLSIPESYGAEYLVVDRARSQLKLDLPVLYEDERYVLHRLAPRT
jgi:hypothetical protein